MTKKNLYVVPTTNTLEVKIQGIIMQSGLYHVGGAGSYGDDDTNNNGDY